MNLQAIIIANGLGAGLMVMLLFSSKNNIKDRTIAGRIYFALVWATIALCLLEITAFSVDGRQFQFASAINVTANVLLFSVNSVFVYLWTVYVDYKIHEDVRRLKRICPFVMLPMVVIVTMSLVSIFYPVLFDVSSQNVYSRTPLTYLAFVVSIGYIVYAEVGIYSQRNTSKNYIFLPSVIFLVPLLIGCALQMAVYGISLMWPCLAISMASIYISLQGETASVDFLSGLFTRQYLDYSLEKAVEEHNGEGTLAGIMIDVNKFKEINDTYGHQAGDEAIRNIGRILRETVRDSDFTARYGGDEFVVISYVKNKKDVDVLTRRIDDALTKFNTSGDHPYELAFSYGVSYFDPEKDDIKKFMKRMDDEMYINKSR